MPLIPLSDNVLYWPSSDGRSPGCTNMGVVIDSDGITVIDTGMVASQWQPFADAVRELDAPVRRVVLTSGDIWHVGGTRAFPNSAIYATASVSELLDQPLPIDAYCAFMPDFTDEFAALALTGTRPVTHLIDAPAVLTECIEVIPAPGHSLGDCIVLVPDADVCFVGSLLSVGARPLCFAGNPKEWSETLASVRDFATRFVPGRGAVGTRADVDAMRAYLDACVDAHGDVAALASGPWSSWSDERFDRVNVECAALRERGDGGIPPTMLSWITPAAPPSDHQ